MNKQEFLKQLRERLSGLPEKDIEERIMFYSEMIDDRMEEGISEEDAVSGVGSVDEIVSQTVADIPLKKLVKEKITPKRKIKAWEIVLLVLGSPVWLSLLAAALAVIFSSYLIVWTLILTLWVAFASTAVFSIGGLVAGVIYAIRSNVLTGIAMIGAAIASAGFSIFLFFGCKALTKGFVRLTKKLVIKIKNRFIKKEEA